MNLGCSSQKWPQFSPIISSFGDNGIALIVVKRMFLKGSFLSHSLMRLIRISEIDMIGQNLLHFGIAIFGILEQAPK